MGDGRAGRPCPAATQAAARHQNVLDRAQVVVEVPEEALDDRVEFSGALALERQRLAAEGFAFRAAVERPKSPGRIDPTTISNRSPDALPAGAARAGGGFSAVAGAGAAAGGIVCYNRLVDQ